MTERIPAITLWQPSIVDMCRPYVAGVLHGDGWCTKLTLGLRVKDRDFAECFASAVRAATGVVLTVAPDERRYWLTRSGNKTGRFSALRAYAPTDDDELGWWLRGLFDSEGNAQINPCKGGPNCYSRRIAIYSTNMETLIKAAGYMEWLSIPHLIRPTKNSATHMGTKVVHELRVLRQAGFARFAEMVGSNIGRKRDAIAGIVDTYQPPGWQARVWQKAVEARWGAK
jgi:hypothetical protein